MCYRYTNRNKCKRQCSNHYKKVKKSPNASLISSEIYLKDNGCIDKNIKFNEKQQKFWSYAKYRTEYTKPIPEEKKTKKTDRGKRTEDPCPCQLFSYACPCTDNKSLTKLAGNSKTITVANQVVSAMKVGSYQKEKVKSDIAVILADKETSARASNIHVEYESTNKHDEGIKRVSKQNGSNNTCNEIKSNNSGKYRCKKSRQYLCPNCNEKVEIVTISEQEESLNLNLSPIHRTQENSSPAQYSYVSNMSQKSKPIADKDSCKHEPPCELVPVCQILPCEQVYSNPTKCFNKPPKLKNMPRTIKVTKACRHHPPCTVAPSCQRLNVLKNNCEYIPPCLHRPRCINLPLCVPFSKTLNYDELINKTANEEDLEYPVYTPTKYVPTHQHDSLDSDLEHRHHFHTTQNTCEYVSEYEPRYFLAPQMNYTSPSRSPYQMPSTMPCDFPKSNKYCQYECTYSKRNRIEEPGDNVGGDAIIYIRDVGCQFRNKHNSQDNSLLHSKAYNASFDENHSKTSNFYSNYHTLRYEDKFTNPLSCGDHSMSTVSTSSIEIDIHCPSHGKDSKKISDTKPITGFEPRQSPVIANCFLEDPILNLCVSKSNNLNKKLRHKSRKWLHTHPVCSRNSFLRNKCKKVFSVRRRGKSRLSYQSIFNLSSAKPSSHKNTL
ncbi:unnamed protein product [Colias eurytheme]|nr:unnamed protein product [Colias eurytheme]